MTSLQATSTSVPATNGLAERAQPRFVGVFRGELFKISRMRTFWIMLVLMLGVIFLPYVVGLARTGLKDIIAQAPMLYLYRQLGTSLYVLRVFGGVLLIVLTAQVIGMEYSSGTIRVVLSRGVGRLQLLAAKLLALTLIAVLLLVIGVALDLVLNLLATQIGAGSLDVFQKADANFWSDARLYVLLVLVSMLVTILMAAAVTVIGRSLAVGLSVGLIWFPADNIGLIFFYLAYKLTNNTFWLLATGDLLGPNINAMAGAVLPTRASVAALGSFNSPLVPVSSGHTLLITGIYALAFALVALVLTWRRDVTE